MLVTPPRGLPAGCWCFNAIAAWSFLLYSATSLRFGRTGGALLTGLVLMTQPLWWTTLFGILGFAVAAVVFKGHLWSEQPTTKIYNPDVDGSWTSSYLYNGFPKQALLSNGHTVPRVLRGVQERDRQSFKTTASCHNLVLSGR